MRLSNWGQELAKCLLMNDYPLHWTRTKLVAARATALGRRVLSDTDREFLVAAAWLHLIGVSIDLQKSGFVPLDGAHYVRSTTDLPDRVAELIAHQSSAATTAVERGLSVEMACFADEESLTRDALWYCVSPEESNYLDPAQRSRVEALQYFLGPGHPMVVAHAAGQMRRRAAVSRVMNALVTTEPT